MKKKERKNKILQLSKAKNKICAMEDNIPSVPPTDSPAVGNCKGSISRLF